MTVIFERMARPCGAVQRGIWGTVEAVTVATEKLYFWACNCFAGTSSTVVEAKGKPETILEGPGFKALGGELRDIYSAEQLWGASLYHLRHVQIETSELLAFKSMECRRAPCTSQLKSPKKRLVWELCNRRT